MKRALPFGYVPEIRFRNLSWTDHLVGSRFPALAGWQKNDREVFDVLNEIARTIFRQFRIGGHPCLPEHDATYGENERGFGFGTVHHAVGTLRMPYRARYNDAAMQPSVVDEELKVLGTDNLYVCDMSVMPFSSAANPVRTLVALALRLSRRLRQ